MQQNFNIGDVVVLKSGSPAMTVESYHINPMDGEQTTTVWCSWFDDSKRNKEMFEQDALMLESELD